MASKGRFTARANVSKTLSKGIPCADIRIAITDTGIGIPIEKQEIIFQKFSQADNSITRQFGGSGLGLSISKNLAGLMGGLSALKAISAKALLLPYPYACRYQIISR